MPEPEAKGTPGLFQPGFDMLTISLSAAVPLRIIEIIRSGGPTDADFERIQSYREDLTAHGDDLYFQSTKKGETAHRFNQVADAIAVMSFLPGGVPAFGLRFDGNAMKARMAATANTANQTSSD